MIEVSTGTYKAIEESLEDWWEDQPWKRIWTGGKPGTYKEVTSRFDLIINEESGKVTVKLVNKEDSSVVPYCEVFDKFMEDM